MSGDVWQYVGGFDSMCKFTPVPKVTAVYKWEM